MSKVGKTILGTTLALLLGGGGAYTGYVAIQKTKLENDNKNLTEVVAKTEKENSELKTKQAELESQIVNLGINLVNSNNEITELNNKLTKTTNDLNVAKENITSLNSELEIEKTKVQTLTTEKNQLALDKSNLQSQLDETTQNLTAKTNEYNQVCEDLETANGNVAELQNKKTELENQIQTLNSDKTNLLTQLANKTAEYNSKVSELETAQANIQSLTNAKTELENQVETLTIEKTTLETTITEKETTIVDLQNQIKVLQAKIEELEKNDNFQIVQTWKLKQSVFNNQSLIGFPSESQYAIKCKTFVISSDGICYDNLIFNKIVIENNQMFLVTENGIKFNVAQYFSSSNCYSLANWATFNCIYFYEAPSGSLLTWLNSNCDLVQTYSYTLKNPVEVLTFDKVNISFTSNNEHFTGIQYSENGLEFFYEDGSSRYIGSIMGDIDSNYLTLIFDTEPTGDLLTWLQNNDSTEKGTDGDLVTE